MKVIHSGSLDVRSGGPALSTYLTIKGLRNEGIEAELVMPPVSESGRLIGEDVTIHYTAPIRLARLGYAPGMMRMLKSMAAPDLFHVQGLWQHMGHKVVRHALYNRIPYVMTLRGMLYPQALKKSHAVKMISMAFYQRDDLQRANCVQCTCHEEMEHYRALGFTNPVAIIPNPIETAGVIEREISTPDRLRIGYLGRVHPRKRIERLIYAFDALREKLRDAELLIIGGGDEEYEKFLRKEVERLNLSNVRFAGFLSGQEKDEAICSLSYLAVPSDFENFGNIVTEALVRGIPVITSKGTPWEVLEEKGCGWWIDNSQEEINRAIEAVISIPEEERTQMGSRGKELILEQFSVETLGKKMAQLYQWVLKKGEKPEFVYTINN